MSRQPEACTISGSCTRYSCRTTAEVDAHLRGITRWARTPAGTEPSVWRVAMLRRFQGDIDLLLNARTMLAALDGLDADLDALAAVEVAP